MARVYLISEEEMQSLIEQLELGALRRKVLHEPLSTIHKDIDDLHRSFHDQVVLWARAMGFEWRRK